MTPHLQQALKVLQMSTLDVSDFIAQEVERNPLLKIDEGGGERASAAEAAQPKVDREIARDDPGRAEDGFDTGGENLPNAGDRLGRGGEPASSRSAGEAAVGFEEFTAAAESLRDQLLAQISMMRGDERARLVAQYLVDEIDEDGYLRADLDDLADRIDGGEELIADALDMLQACDPAGVGARGLKECFALQLRRLDRYDPAMATLVDRLEDLAAHRYDKLRALCGVDQEDLEDMIAELRLLDPRPGAAVGAPLAETVIPDVFVKPNQLGGWSVEVNSDALPKVLLDTTYAAELDGAGEEARSFLKGCRKDADWLLRLIDQRAQTILKVSTEIVRRQSLYFAEGVAGLRPMTLRDVAETIDMHESTVSRVTANKHLYCSRGLIPLKFFFTKAIAAADGSESVSAEAVRAEIKTLIGKENPGHPLSDEKIVAILKQNGVSLARRTVAKYREAMNIPSSSKRKRMKAVAFSR